MKLQKVSMLRFLIGCACLLLMEVRFVSVAFGQLGFPGQMFDPDCYFPRVGTPGEIDTIYGSVPYQGLGDGLTGIGPAPGEKYNRIAFQGFEPVSDTDPNFPVEPFDVFQGGPNFRVNALHPLAKLGIQMQYCQFAHLRSQQYLDAIYSEEGWVTIYWADQNGLFDTNRTTLLREGTRGDQHMDPDGAPIIGRFSHDSTDDILMFYDTVCYCKFYLSWYDGQKLFGTDTAYADSTIYFDTIGQNRPGEVRVGRAGDYRGTGRTSFIGGDNYLNAYFFANDAPFSVSEFARSMKTDTLMTHWENAQFGIKSRMGAQIYGNSIAMSVFPKAVGDHSQDFLTLQFDSLDRSNRYPGHIYCFKGGPDFGKRRLYLDSADYILHTPQEFSTPGFGLAEYGMHNCGDMTGTCYNVLELFGEYGNGLNSFFFFYVTGKALDSRVDMAYEIDPNGGGLLDTLTADADQLEDVIIGMPAYNTYADAQNNRIYLGTIHVVHGSKKIPVHLNPQFDVARQEIQTVGMDLYPNPARQNASIILRGFGGEEVSVELRDVLGRDLFQENHRCSTNADVYRMDIAHLAAGSYVIEIRGSKTLVAKLTIVK